MITCMQMLVPPVTGNRKGLYRPKAGRTHQPGSQPAHDGHMPARCPSLRQFRLKRAVESIECENTTAA